jgi:hypothetical protein
MTNNQVQRNDKAGINPAMSMILMLLLRFEGVLERREDKKRVQRRGEEWKILR